MTHAADGPDIKPRSRDVTDGLEKAAARGMLRAFSFSDQVERLIKHARKATDYHLLGSGALQRLHAGFAG